MVPAAWVGLSARSEAADHLSADSEAPARPVLSSGCALRGGGPGGVRVESLDGLPRFIRASAKQRQALCERRLEPYDVVVLLLDGKTFAEDEIVIALGITVTGEKVVLGFVQTATENEPVCAAFLRELIDRGLQIEDGLLCVIDGAKGPPDGLRCPGSGPALSVA